MITGDGYEKHKPNWNEKLVLVIVPAKWKLI
jgi:hypothetical protein